MIMTQSRLATEAKIAVSTPLGTQKLYVGERFGGVKPALQRGAMLCATLFLMGALQGAAHADDFTWTGATSNDWNTSGNWTRTAGTTRDFPDNAVDTATFPTPVTTNKTPNISASVTVNKLTFNADGYEVASAGQTLTLGGTTPNVSVGGTSVIATISATVAGTGFTKSSPGTVILSGTNIFDPASTLNFTAGSGTDAGAIRLASNGALGGVTTINELATGSAKNRLELSGGITVGSGVTINVGGRTNIRTTDAALLNASENNTWAGAIRITGPGGGVGVRSASGTLLTLSGVLSATIATRTFDIGDAGDILVTGAFSNGTAGAVAYTKFGTGKLTYAGANTYTGTTTISAGTLQVGNGGTTGVISSSAAGSVVNSASLVFNRSNGLTVGNLISGTGTVTQAGTGNTVFTNVNTYTGATTVAGGVLDLKRTTQTAIAGASAVTVADGATLQITDHAGGGQQPYANALTLNGSGAGGIGALSFLNSGLFSMSGTINLASNTTIRTDAAGQAANSLITFSNVISGASNLTLRAISSNNAGTPQFALTGANTYSGNTLITSNSTTAVPFQVILNGSLTSATTVDSNAVLGGNGTISNSLTVASGGTHAPGVAGPGTENTGNYTLASGSTLAAQINGTTVGTGYDQVNVTGTVDVTGATLSLSSTGYTSAVGDVFTLINNDGTDPVVGNFTGLSEGATVTVGGNNFTISYIGGISGNDVVLTAAAASPADTSGAIISEFRFIGPSGATNQYVELYNTTNAPLNISNWKISFNTGSANQPLSQDSLVPQNTVIPAFGHFLFTGTGYSLGSYGASDKLIGAIAANDSGVALFNAAGAVQDAAGFNTSLTTLREGAGLDSAPTSNSQHAFMRRFKGQLPVDTGDNAADFLLLTTDGAAVTGTSIAPQLGAPNPEGLASPNNINAQIGVRVLDANFGPNVAPNRVRNGSGNGGSLVFRRIIKNNGTQPLSRIRLLVTDITGQVSPVVAGQADVRLTSQADENVAVAGQGTVLVYGTTLEAPSNLPSGTGPTTVGGGGIGSSVNYDIVLTTPLAAGAERPYTFNVQVAKTGSFFININVLGK